MTYPNETGPLELINQARQLLNAEYLKKCTDEYKTWASSNPYASHRTGEALLRFPPFAAILPPIGFRSTISPPSEKDVVNKALELYNQNKPIETPPVTTASETETPAVEPAVSVPEPVQEAIVEPTPEPEAILNQPAEPEPQKAEEAPTTIPKDTQFANKIFDIFKGIGKTPGIAAVDETEDKKEELPTPSIDTPVENTVVESTASDEQNIEIEEPPPPLVPPEPIVPIIPLPPMEPIPVPPPAPLPTLTPEPTPEPTPVTPPTTPAPLTVSPYVQKVQEIFKDVPQQSNQESFTSILKKAFFGKKENI